MKYLSDYTEAGATALLNQYGGFYAFSDKQLAEHRKPGVEYCSLGMGLICPKENAAALKQGLLNNYAEGIRQDIAENGKENIIRRELANHEAYYTGEIDQTRDALQEYGFTDEEIWAVYREEAPKNSNW